LRARPPSSVVATASILPHPPSSPTRRSSDLADGTHGKQIEVQIGAHEMPRKSWVFKIKDGLNRVLIVVPDGQVTETGEISFVKRSEEHTSELQSRENLVCRPLLDKKKIRHQP